MKKTVRVQYSVAFIVSLITFLVYLPALQNGFINWDDDLYVEDNTHIRSLGLPFLKWVFFDFYAAYWHPLTWISHAFDYAVWGLNPAGHHLTNNILHMVNTLLVVLLAMKLTAAGWRSEDSGSSSERFTSGRLLIVGGVAGVLFGLHPLHVESAAWVAERKDLLCALFFLLSAMQYIVYAGGPERQFSRFSDKRFIAAVGFFLLALCSKPMAVSLPVILLVLDWFPFGRIRSLRDLKESLVEKLPFIALSLISSMLIILAHQGAGAIASTAVIPLSTRLLVAAKSLVAYLGMMLWPADLYPYYPYPAGVSLASWMYGGSLLLVAVVTTACIVLAKRRKLWLTVWSCYCVSLLPVLGIVQVGPQAMADRFFYLPSLGPFIVVGLGAASAWRAVQTAKRGKSVLQVLVFTAVLIIPAGMSWLTLRQIGFWKDGLVLWNRVIEKEPLRAFAAYNNRGVFFEKAGRPDRALQDYQKTIELNPLEDQAYFNIGNLYYKAGDYHRALEQYSEAIAINPNKASLFHNRGVARSALNQLDGALLDLNRAIELEGGLEIAYFSRARLYEKKGSPELAMSDFRRACGLGYRDACAAVSQ